MRWLCHEIIWFRVVATAKYPKFDWFFINILFSCRQPKRKIREPQIAKLLKKSPARKPSIADDNLKLTPKKSEISEEETRKCHIAFLRSDKPVMRNHELYMITNFHTFLSVDEDDIDEEVGVDNEPEAVSLATMLSAADDFDGYDEPY